MKKTVSVRLAVFVRLSMPLSVTITGEMNLTTELDGPWTCATCLEEVGQDSPLYKEWQTTETEEIGADNTQRAAANVENSNLKL